jgi:hypothetical protein
MSEGAVGHAVDAVMLAAEAGEHALMAGYHLSMASSFAVAGQGADAIAAFSDAAGLSTASHAAHVTASSAHALTAEELQAAGSAAQDAWHALAGTPPAPAPPPQPPQPPEHHVPVGDQP